MPTGKDDDDNYDVVDDDDEYYYSYFRVQQITKFFKLSTPEKGKYMFNILN